MLSSLFVALGLLGLIGVVNGQTTVSVSASASHPIPTTLWGQMFEASIESGDGGLYAELLQNRAFQLVTPGTTTSLAGWQPVNGGNISVIKETSPVSSALPNALQLTFPSGTTGSVGFANTGFSGIKSPQGRHTPLHFSSASQPARPSKKLGRQLTDIDRTVTVKLKPTTTPSSTSNLFTITLDGASASGQTVNFAMLSLFPPTFKNRANGMRVDIATALSEMAPSFFRLPGGNNLEGQTVATRWQWNATVGPLVDRPGRTGDWGYTNTDGLGLLEYLHWCEDLNMQPIMAVWSGYALGGTSVAEGQLEPYIQQAIDQINFVIGDPAKSQAAALRASLGHPEPFKLNFVEVGNEDFFAATSYVYRWHDFVTTLQAEFPNIHFIATSDTFNPILSPDPTEYDVHVYQTPTWFAQNSFFYDDFERNNTKYFEGEYAAISTNPTISSDHLLTVAWYSPLCKVSAAGEAAFMTGLERNSDIVFAASYAPLLGHVTNNQWTPNLLAFDAGTVYHSTSYYVQKLFSLNRGDEYLPSTLPSRTGTLFWSVVRNTSTQEVIIKVDSFHKYLEQALTSTVATSGSAQILTGNATASNTPTDPTLFAPITSKITTGKTFNFTAPPVSVSVLTIKAH
ncbi:arabinofuranosidase [Cyathus striatus]|nr:arabinofuranosidase [Cyathus striatus]